MTFNSQIGSYSYRLDGIRPHAVSIAGANNYTYDNNGNMTGGTGRTIIYDPENRPMTVTKAGVTTNFYYDGNGERVKKSTSTSTTIYIGKHYECTNGVCEKYIFANGQRIVKKTVGTGVTYYYHSDHLGESSVITAGNGSKVEALAYFPYGATRLDSGGPNVRHKFTGQELDPETGLYFYNARYYDPALGRFISADTIIPDPSDPQAFNRYSYVRNNPLKYTDPDGHFFWIPVIVAAAVGGTHGDIFNESAWSHFDVQSAVISAAGAAVGQYAYIGVGGGLMGNIAAGTSGGFVQGGLSSGRLDGAFQGALQGGVAGGINFALSEAVPIFSMKGYQGSVSNPITSSISSAITASIFGGDPWKAGRDSFWSSTLTNIGTMAYNYSNGNPSPSDGEAHYGSRRILASDSIGWRIASVFGIGHSFFYDSGTGNSKEAYADGANAAKEYSPGSNINSTHPDNRGFGTWYDPATVSYSSISTGPLSPWSFSNTCNSWSVQYMR